MSGENGAINNIWIFRKALNLMIFFFPSKSIIYTEHGERT